MSRPLSRVPFRWLWPTFPYLCALRFAMGTLWTTEVVILTGRSILPAGASNEDTPEVMAMKAELVALRAFKATTTPAATTGAGKRACAQQDRLPKLRASGELHDPSATSNSGEKGRRCGNCQYQQEPRKSQQELSKSRKSHARVKQEPSKSHTRGISKSDARASKSNARATQEPCKSL